MKYRIYIDEVGNHDMFHSDEINHRFLSLTGIILEAEYNMKILQPEIEKIKADFFQADPDEPIIFHRKEMMNKRWPFHSLRNPEIQARFDEVLLGALKIWKYQVVTVVIDKLAHREKYHVWHYHPCHYCLEVLLERYVLFLHHGGVKGDALVESRGKIEDEKLKESYERLYQKGSVNIPGSTWQTCLSSKELKVKPKKANIAGLQLADIVAHPSRREILKEHGLLDDGRNIFGDKICEILRAEKYLRNSTSGRIEEHSKKLLP